MKLVIQRVKWARVKVDGNVVGKIGRGMLVLFGAEKGDVQKELEWAARKVANLRIFEDENNKMNLSVKDIGGSLLVVSQFTLASDCRKGNRPSFDAAMEPGAAEKMYERFIGRIREMGLDCQQGVFGAMMEVELLNWGPVTFAIEPKS